MSARAAKGVSLEPRSPPGCPGKRIPRVILVKEFQPATYRTEIVSSRTTVSTPISFMGGDVAVGHQDRSVNAEKDHEV